MIFRKIDIGRQGNFMLGLLLIHFVFFGYLSNVYVPPNYIGTRVLFLYQVLFSPESFLSLIILFLIIFFMTYREHFFEYGMRNSIWTIPFIMVESWIWYWFIYDFDITIIGVYFIRIETYINLVILLAIILSATFSGAIVKQKYMQYKERSLKLTTATI